MGASLRMKILVNHAELGEKSRPGPSGEQNWTSENPLERPGTSLSVADRSRSATQKSRLNTLRPTSISPDGAGSLGPCQVQDPGMLVTACHWTRERQERLSLGKRKCKLTLIERQTGVRVLGELRRTTNFGVAVRNKRPAERFCVFPVKDDIFRFIFIVNLKCKKRKKKQRTHATKQIYLWLGRLLLLFLIVRRLNARKQRFKGFCK